MLPCGMLLDAAAAELPNTGNAAAAEAVAAIWINDLRFMAFCVCQESQADVRQSLFLGKGIKDVG